MGVQQNSGDKLVAYYRVSTKRQGQSGLGLQAQQSAAEAYARQASGVITKCFQEVESGRNSARPQLQAALAYCRSTRSKLVIAKLDRLARNVHFVSGLMESGVDFVACDNPNANRLTIHILAAVAEDEARRISERTKAALEAARERGVKLGSARPGFWDGRRRDLGCQKPAEVSARTRRARVQGVYEPIMPIILRQRRETGSEQARTYEEIAADLNEQGYVTSTGGRFTKSSVCRLVKRYGNSQGIGQKVA